MKDELDIGTLFSTEVDVQYTRKVAPSAPPPDIIVKTKDLG